METFNKEIHNQDGMQPIRAQIYQLCSKFVGHVLRMVVANQQPNMALNWALEGIRRHGRPSET